MEISLKRRFIGNTGWMMAQNIYSMLLSLIIGSLSARYLGPSNYGLLNYGTSIIAFFSIISKLGFDSLIVSEIVKNPKKCESYLGSALLMRFIASILSFISIIIIVNILEPQNKLLQILTILQAFSLIFESHQVLFYWFQKELKMKYVTICTMISLTITGIWRIVLLATKASIEWFAISASISALVCGITIWLFFRINTNIKLKFSLNDSRYLLKYGYHFVVSGLAVTLYTQIDRIMLGKVISSESVGFYSAAVTIANMWQFIPSAIINSSRPLIIAKYKDDYKDYINKFKYLLLVITIMGVIVGCTFILFGKYIIYILYGKSYLQAVLPLKILIWATGFSMIGTARGIWIAAEGLYKYSKKYILIGAITNVVLNFIFIPKWGIIGASITTLISQIVVCLIAPLFYKKTREFVKIYFDSYNLLSKLIKNKIS